MAELNDAEKNLRDAFEKVFARLPLIPEDEIAEVHSSGYCEDGRTFMLMLSTKDGKTICVQAEPGKSLAVGTI